MRKRGLIAVAGILVAGAWLLSPVLDRGLAAGDASIEDQAAHASERAGQFRLDPLPLKKQVAEADAIVVGRIADIDGREYRLSLLDKAKKDAEPRMTMHVALAILHPQTVLKTDSETIINRADKSNPNEWMHLAFMSPRRGDEIGCGGPLTAEKGENLIWFLERDRCMTGHYFIRHKAQITDATIQEIRRFIDD